MEKPTERVAKALAAVNTPKEGAIKVRYANTAPSFFEAWREATAREDGPYESELVGLIHKIPKLFETACYYARNPQELLKFEEGGRYLKGEAAEKACEKIADDEHQNAVDLLRLLVELADYSNTHTMLKYDLLQPTAANMFNKILKSIYDAECRTLPFADKHIAAIVMRYLGAPNQQFPTGKASEYLLYAQVVRTLFEYMWGLWYQDEEMLPYIIRALDRTDQLTILMLGPKYNDIIPALVRYAEEKDSVTFSREKGSYGEFDPENPGKFFWKHANDMGKEYSGILGIALSLIKIYYFRKLSETTVLG
ncbi:hypothetical protein KKA15_00015 [Patescibacteria group bacterium]|nr:hypothetical protein [Patescibacteria group bacterium]